MDQSNAYYPFPDYLKAQASQNQSQSNATQLRQESLATVAPRVLQLGEAVQKHCSRSLEASFGISVPSPGKLGGSTIDEVPNLMNQLCILEKRLDDAFSTLQRIHQHVNG